MNSSAPYFRCMRCGQKSETEVWDEFTRKQYGEGCKPISEGFQSRSWMFVCPCCGKSVSAPDIQEHWPDIGLDFWGRNE